MKITLKSTEDLIKLTSEDGNIEENLLDFFKRYGGKTLDAIDFSVIRAQGKNFFTFECFESRNRFRAPQEWCDEIDLEDINMYYCRRCGFKVDGNNTYHLAEGLITIDDNDTETTSDDTRVRETYQMRLDSGKECNCPVCFKSNSFLKVDID